MISYVCRDNTSRVQLANKKKPHDHHILVTETLATREAVIAIIQKQLSKVIIESDSFIVVQAIRGEINPPS